MMFAQITDLHIKANRNFAYQKVDTASCLEAQIAHLNNFSPKLDLVLITGDNVDFGTIEEYELLKEFLGQLQIPFYLIPGNHDHRERMAQVFCDHHYLKTEIGFTCYSLEQFPLRLIGFDTTEIGSPHGVVCETRLQWLDQCLAKQPNKPTLIFMHHPPFDTGIGHMDAIRLKDSDGFFEVLKHHKQIVHVACGHIHRAIETMINGVPISIAPSPAHSVHLDLRKNAPSSFSMEPPATRIFRFNENGYLVSHLSYIGEFDGPYPFFDGGGRLID